MTASFRRSPFGYARAEVDEYIGQLRGEIDAALAAQERYDVSHLHALAEENEQIARKLMEEA